MRAVAGRVQPGVFTLAFAARRLLLHRRMRLTSSLLASLLLPLLATACDDVPRSEAYAVLDGDGFEGGTVDLQHAWYLPGSQHLVRVGSDDRELTSWSLASDDDVVVSAGVPYLLPPSENDPTVETRLTSWVVGDAVIAVYDDRDALVTELAAHVRHPDRISAISACDGISWVVGDAVQVLRGSTTPLGLLYSAEGHTLHGDPQVGLASGSQGGAALSGDGDELSISSSDAPYAVRLVAGPDAILDLAVSNVAAEAATLTIEVDEEGDRGWAHLNLRDAAGACVYSGLGVWTLDGATLPDGYGTNYDHDPDAALSELRVTIPTTFGDLTATAMVHAASEAL